MNQTMSTTSQPAKAITSMGDNLRAVIIGASGGIGKALTQELSGHSQIAHVYALSRSPLDYDAPNISEMRCDFTDASSLNRAAASLKDSGAEIDIVIIATGLLQGEGIEPEKNMRAMSHENFAKSFMSNTIGPAMAAQALLPLMRRERKAVFTALSARVGSISDNRLGGWYAYRAAKAALNMVIKTLSIEYGRRFPDIIIAGLHPGTVDTELSKPFSRNVPDGKLFTPKFSAQHLISVIDGLEPKDSGGLYAWDGEKIEF